MKNKQIVAVVILAVLIFSTVSAFGASRTVGTCQSIFKATSSTSAKAEITASSNGDASVLTSKITLQSATIGSTTFSNVSGVSAETYTIKNATLIRHTCNFPITGSKDYRIKIELTDQIDGIKTTTTYFCNLSR